MGVVVRWPATSPPPCEHPRGPIPCDTHLWADPDAADPAGFAQYADVLVARTAMTPPDARRRVHRLLVRHPGALVAVVPLLGTGTGGCLVGVREETPGGVRCLAIGAEEFSERAAVPALAVGSVVHAWVAAGWRLP